MEERVKISLEVTRDSVCAGDDVDAPHKKEVLIDSSADPKDFLFTLLDSYELPKVAGFGHSWDCILNDQLIGQYRGQKAIGFSVRSSFESFVNSISFKPTNRLHFKYNSSEF